MCVIARRHITNGKSIFFSLYLKHFQTFFSSKNLMNVIFGTSGMKTNWGFYQSYQSTDQLLEKRRNCWIKSLFLFSFFAHKKYSLRFIILGLNDCSHVTTLMISLLLFWTLNVVISLLSMGDEKPLRFHQNILICVPKMNKGPTGVERHDGEQLISLKRNLILGWTNPLKHYGRALKSTSLCNHYYRSEVIQKKSA